MRLILLGFVSFLVFASATFALEKGNKCPNFKLPSLSAGDVTLSQFKGNVVLIDFWASWCAPCKKSIPWLNAMQAKYGPAGLKVIAVNLDTDPEAASKLIAEGANLLVAFDPQGKTPEIFGLDTMPSSFLIDKNGNASEIFKGFNEGDKDVFEEKIRNLLSGG